MVHPSLPSSPFAHLLLLLSVSSISLLLLFSPHRGILIYRNCCSFICLLCLILSAKLLVRYVNSNLCSSSHLCMNLTRSLRWDLKMFPAKNAVPWRLLWMHVLRLNSVSFLIVLFFPFVLLLIAVQSLWLLHLVLHLQHLWLMQFTVQERRARLRKSFVLLSECYRFWINHLYQRKRD